MNALELLSSPVAYRLGWTLVHSLWEAAAVGILAWIVLAMLRRRSPQVRYVTASAAMATILLLTVATCLVVEAPETKAPVAASVSAAAAAPIAPPVGPALPPVGPRVAAPRGPAAPAAVVAVAPAAAAEAWTARWQRAVEPHLPWLVAAWLAGVLALSLWRVGGWVAAYRLRVVGTQPAGPAIESMARRLIGRLGLTRPVRIMQSLVVQTPMVIGWLRPVILLPVSAVMGLTPDQLEAILAHELAHIRRLDYLLNLLQAVIEVILFYHPAVWWIGRRMRAERERCCDDVAVGVLGNPIRYVEALAAVEGVRQPASRTAVAASGSGGRDLVDRVRRLLGLPEPARASAVASATAILLVAALLAISIMLGVSCHGTGSPAPGEEFVKADVTLYVDASGNRIKPVTATLTDACEVAKLAAFFPDVGRGRKAWKAAGWMAGMTVDFARANGKVVHVAVSQNDNLTVWSEGEGDWDVEGDLAAYLPPILQKIADEAKAAEPPWGDAVEGAAVRLRAAKTAWKAGEAPTFLLDLRAGNLAYDFMDANSDAQRWEVTVDSRTYLWQERKPQQDLAWSQTVEAGGQCLSAVSLILPGPYVAKDGGAPLALAPGKHTVKISVYAQPIHPHPRGTSVMPEMGTRRESNPVEIEILPARAAAADDKTPWGEAVDGVQLRLRPGKTVWQDSEVPCLLADVRNTGARAVLIYRVLRGWQAEVDGKSNDYPGLYRGASSLEPGGEFTDILVRLDVASGKHTVRVATRFLPAGGDAAAILRGQGARVVSNAAEVEMLASREKAGARPEVMPPLPAWSELESLLGRPVDSEAVKAFVARYGLSELPDGGGEGSFNGDELWPFSLTYEDSRITHAAVAISTGDDAGPAWPVYTAALPHGLLPTDSPEEAIQRLGPPALEPTGDAQGNCLYAFDDCGLVLTYGLKTNKLLQIDMAAPAAPDDMAAPDPQPVLGATADIEAALKVPGRIVAVCEAAGGAVDVESSWADAAVRWTQQQKVLAVLDGPPVAKDAGVTIEYFRVEPAPHRQAKPGESLIWIALPRDQGSLRVPPWAGIMAFADTPEARKVILERAKAAENRPPQVDPTIGVVITPLNGSAFTLPGLQVDLRDALKRPKAIVAVCQAADVIEDIEQMVQESGTGRLNVTQPMKVLEVIGGRSDAKDICLDYVINMQHAEWQVEKGERVIWIAEPAPAQPDDKLPRWKAIKALADVPESRKILAAAANLPAPPVRWPGSDLSLEEAMKAPDRVIAACQAEWEWGEGASMDPVGTDWQQQWFTGIERLDGGPKLEKVDILAPRGLSPGREESAVPKDARAIWIAKPLDASLPDETGRGYWIGIKALPDTPENRKAVIQADTARRLEEQKAALKEATTPDKPAAQARSIVLEASSGGKVRLESDGATLEADRIELNFAAPTATAPGLTGIVVYGQGKMEVNTTASASTPAAAAAARRSASRGEGPVTEAVPGGILKVAATEENNTSDWKWTFTAKGSDKEQRLPGVSALGSSIELLASPDGKYLAVLSECEGCWSLCVVDLALLLGKHEVKEVGDAGTWPSGMSLAGWKDGTLLVDTPQLLTHTPAEGDLDIAFDEDQRFSLDPATGEFTAVSAEARDPVKYFMGRLAAKDHESAGEAAERLFGAVDALRQLKAVAAVPDLRKALAACADADDKATIQKTVAYLTALPAEGAKAAETPWGEAVEGVQARLTPDKAQWKAGEKPTLRLEIRNQGGGTLWVPEKQFGTGFVVNVDGHPYIDMPSNAVQDDLRTKSEPGAKVRPVEVILGDTLREGERALALRPGRHAVRVTTMLQRGTDALTTFKVTSNPVEIEVLPAATVGAPAGKPDEAVQRRQVNRAVKDFPEARDLSTPESACAAWNRASGHMDAKALAELSHIKLDPAEMEAFWKRDGKDIEVYNQAQLDAEIVEVLTYKDDLAGVITKLKFPEGVGRDPFSFRTFGRINGQWKNLGEGRFPSLEAARKGFEGRPGDVDAAWTYFQLVKEQVLGKAAPAAAPPGPPVPVGKVVELTLYDVRTMKASLADLETGTVIQPDFTKVKGDDPAGRAWMKDHGIDLAVVARTDAGDAAVGGYDMQAVMIDNEAFDAAQLKDIERRLKIAPRQVGVAMSVKDGLPVTYALRTREGSVVVLQITAAELAKAPQFVKIRYKILARSQFERMPAVETDATRKAVEILNANTATLNLSLWPWPCGRQFRLTLVRPRAGVKAELESGLVEVTEGQAKAIIDRLAKSGFFETAKRNPLKADWPEGWMGRGVSIGADNMAPWCQPDWEASAKWLGAIRDVVDKPAREVIDDYLVDIKWWQSRAAPKSKMAARMIEGTRVRNSSGGLHLDLVYVGPQSVMTTAKASVAVDTSGYQGGKELHYAWAAVSEGDAVRVIDLLDAQGMFERGKPTDQWNLDNTAPPHFLVRVTVPEGGPVLEMPMELGKPLWDFLEALRGAVHDTGDRTKVDEVVTYVLDHAPKAAKPPAAPAAKEAEKAGWVALAPLSPIRSMKEYWHLLATDPPPVPPLYKDVPIPECYLEIRKAADQKRVAQVPLAGSLREFGRPDAEQVRRIGDLPDGEYVVALVAPCTRCSNVSRLVIDSKFDAAKLPALQLVPTPLAPGGGLLHVAVVGTGRTPVDPQFTNASILFPPLMLIVDGVERKYAGPPQVIAMPVGPLGSGQRDQRWLDLSQCEPKIDPAAKHTVVAKAGKYESAPEAAPADGALDAAWDKETPPGPAPAPHVSVSGTVTGPDGKPAAGYQVSLLPQDKDGGEEISVRCNAKGGYEFVNVPAGQYDLTARPAEGDPKDPAEVTVSEVHIDARQAQVRDLTLEGKFVYSGRVRYADNMAAAGLEVMASGSSPEAKTEWTNTATINAKGEYTIRAPYPVADYIGLSGTGEQPDPYHDVKAGRKDLDFIAPGVAPAPAATKPAAAPAPATEPAKELTLDLGGGATMKLALIPAGKFLMGEEKDPHEVTISRPFYMGATLVTQAQYEAVMGANPSHFKGATNPVDTVSWNDAAEFCRKLSEKTGRTVRLPTEAEWEYACRAGTKTEFSFGDDDKALGDYAWYSVNSDEATHPVGQKKPNPWGLYDMHGNIWQWCADWYAEYPKGTATDPPGPASGKYRVSRGGSWNFFASFCSSASRYIDLTPDARRDFNYGFRVVVTVPAPAPAGT